MAGGPTCLTARAYGHRRLGRRRPKSRHVVSPLAGATLADGAVMLTARMATSMIVATVAATHALPNESTHHPTPSSHRGSRLVPTTVPYSLDWTANSIGAWDSRNPEVRDLSHSKNTNPYRLGVRGAPGDGAPLTTKRHQ